MINNSSNKQLVALIIQNNPKLLNKTQNIKQCRKMIQNQNKWKNLDDKCKQDLDLIMFPQMAFTGYNFKDYDHVLPIACFANEDKDFQFAKQIALNYKSYVLFGYVQKVKKQKKHQNDYQFNLYNSAALIDRTGKLVLNTRKSHLYFCDQLWSLQGQGFRSIEITNKKGQLFNCVVAICMDINQKNFKSGEWQLANFIIRNKCQALLFVSNWTDNSPQTNQKKQLIHMMNYWLYRLSPLLQEKQPQRLFLISDRVGSQYNYYDKKQSWFFGCSGGLNINPPQIYSILDKKQQNCILIRGKIPIIQNK